MIIQVQLSIHSLLTSCCQAESSDTSQEAKDPTASLIYLSPVISENVLVHV